MLPQFTVSEFIDSPIRTSGVVASREKDAPGSFSQADDVTGSGRGEDTVLADEKLLDAIGGTNLGNQLDDLGIPEATITSNDQERV